VPGLLAGVTGGGLGAYVLAMKLAGGLFRDHIAAIVVAIMLVTLGFQFVFIGLIGEMLVAPPQPRFVMARSRELAGAPRPAQLAPPVRALAGERR